VKINFRKRETNRIWLSTNLFIAVAGIYRIFLT